MDDEYFMRKALIQAGRALAAGEFPVGCVLVYQGAILVSSNRQGTLGNRQNELDHAEMVALRHLIVIDDPIDNGQVAVFCTMEPCLMCFSALILAGIGKIVYAYEDAMGGGSECDLTRLKPLYKNSSIKVVRSVLRNESLQLFKAYFSNPANHYWKGSLLARYTLSQ
jgi:tRNA(adenine34) deaminase